MSKTFKNFLVPTFAFIVGFGFSLLIVPEVPFFGDFTASQNGCTYRTVSHVVDGDTFDLENGTRVRMIGIDAPELNTEFFGKEARGKLKAMIGGEPVCLKRKPDENTGKYGRLLRFVYEGDVSVAAQMVKNGYARVYLADDFHNKERLLQLKREAKKARLGMWNAGEKNASREDMKAARSLEECPGKIVCAEEAMEHIGEEKIVRFFVEASYNSGGAVFLNSLDNYKDPKNFTAVIFRSNFAKFPKKPAQYYGGETVVVMGKIKKYEGRAEIILEGPRQIKVVQ